MTPADALSEMPFREHMERALDALQDALDADILVDIKRETGRRDEDAVRVLMERLEAEVRARLSGRLECA